MRTRDNLLIDATVLTCCLLAANPGITGITGHEWLGLSFGVTALVHLALHGDWVARAVRGLFGRTPRRSRGLLALSAATGAAGAAALVSGLAVSRSILPALGVTWNASAAWHVAHAVSSYSLIALAVAHLAVHWRWIAKAARLHIVEPISGVLGGSMRPEPAAKAVAWGVPALLLAGLITLGALGAGGASTAYATSNYSAASSASGSTLTCPRTGCTASSCHATSGTSGGGGAFGHGPGRG